MQIPDVINKLLDNANLGKVVTDVGAGLALAVPLLMIFGLSTGITVIPLDGADEMKTEWEIETKRHLDAEVSFCDPKTAPNADQAHRCFLDGVRKIARLNASLEAIRQRMAADQRASKISPAEWIADQERLQSEADDLMVRQAVVEERAATLAAVNNRLADANSFSFNLRTLGENTGSILAFAVILGVIISQVSRLLFINLWFDRRLKPASTPTAVATNEEYDKLRTNYLRYVEGSINMIPPVLLFGIVYPLYAQQRLGTRASPILWGLGALVVCALLTLSAYNTYESYVKKLRDLPSKPQAQGPKPA